MKLINLLHVFVVILVFTSCTANSANTKSNNAIEQNLLKSVIESQDYFIYANQVKLQDTNGLKNASATKSLDDPKAYFIKVKPRTVEVNLPYFGAGQNPGNEASLILKPTSYTYLSNASKTGWVINITPEKAANIKSIEIDLNANGTAYFTVFTLDRLPSSYVGYIEN